MSSRRNWTSSIAAASSTTPSVAANTMKSDRTPLPESLNIDHGVSPALTVVSSEDRISVLTPNVSVTTSVVTRLKSPGGTGTGIENQSVP